MPPRTIRAIIQEYNELHQHIRVWEEVIGFLERSTSPSSDTLPINPIRMESGTLVDNEVVLDMIAMIEDIIAQSQQRIKELSDLEVIGGGDRDSTETTGDSGVQAGGAGQGGSGAGEGDSEVLSEGDPS